MVTLSANSAVSVLAGNAQFEFAPRGITANSTHILVADTGNDRIQVFNSNGGYLSQFGSFSTTVVRDDGTVPPADGGFNFAPRGITTTSENILVADTNNNRIQIFDLDGTYLSQFGSLGSGDGEFITPRGITANSTHILVADSNNHRIQVFDLDGTYLSSFGSFGSKDGQFNAPSEITATSTHHTGCRHRQQQDTGI